MSKIWDAFKSARDVARNQGNADPPFPLNPFNENREMRRAPNEPKKNRLETPRLLCTCVNNKNLNPHDVNSVNNGCIAKCRKRDKNDTRHAMVLASDESLEVYKWEVQAGQPRRSNCPSCLCICNKLYRIRDIQSIGLGLRQNNMRRVMGNGPTPETQLSQFLGQAMWAGKQAAIDIEAIQRKNGTRTDSNLRDEIYNDAVAEHVTRMSGNLTGSIEMLQKKLGRGTRVDLPAGDRQFDARTVNSNHDFHARNNRFNAAPAIATARGVAPGMLTNLNPDYSNPGPQFQAAAMDPNNLVNTLSSIGANFFAPPPVSFSSAPPKVPPKVIEINDDSPAIGSVIEINDSSAPDSVIEINDSPAPAGSNFRLITTEQYKIEQRAAAKNYALSGQGYLEPCHLQQFDREGVKPPKEFIDPNGSDKWRLGFDTSEEQQLDKAVEESVYATMDNHGGKDPNMPAPPGFPFCPPSVVTESFKKWEKKKRSGGKRILERISGANAKMLHSKVSKKKLSSRQLKERTVAKSINKALIEKSNHSEQIGNSIAQAVGIAPSQISCYADGNVADVDGEFFQSQEGLTQFRRLHTSQSSSDDSY